MFYFFPFRNPAQSPTVHLTCLLVSSSLCQFLSLSWSFLTMTRRWMLFSSFVGVMFPHDTKWYGRNRQDKRMSCVFSLCIFNNAKMKLLARLLQNYFCVLFTASHLGYTMSTCPTTGDVNLDHLVKMIYSVFLHFRVTLFSVSAELYLGADTFGLCECPILKFLSTDFNT